MPRTLFHRSLLVLLVAGALAAGCSSGGSGPGGSGSGSSGPVTIKAVLPPNTGPITAADNAGLQQLTQQYQAAHKNVTVQWLPNNTTGITQANGITPFMFTTGAPCNPSWFERLATSSLLAGQVSQFNVNHAQVTNGLDVAVGIKKGIISMSNPRYAEAWKLLGQLASNSASGESTYDACSNPNTTSPPLSPQSMLIQGKVGILWGGSWWIPQLDSAGFTGKYGVFPEPPITTASTPVALGTSTVGVIAGPNGNGEWSITSQRADASMTPAKTATVMNFIAWLFTPQHLGYWLKINGSGAYIPTEPAAPTVNLPGLSSLVPAGQVPTVVDAVLDDVLSTAATNSGMRLVQEYVGGSLSYSAFASQWQSLLTSSAQAWATQNHVDLSKY
jgi:hypothetical protein